jgi:hypothetical protein
MNDRDFDQLLDAWMDLGPTVAPARVAEAVRLEARSTRQTASLRGWPPRRFPEMNTTVRLALAAAAVVAAAVLGYAYLAGPSVGDTTIPQPSSQPGASIRADLPLLTEQDGSLDPGTYAVTEIEPMRLAITVPRGWSRNVAPDTVWTEDSTVTIWFGRVDELNTDPCAASTEMTALSGPTVDDFADALAALPSLDAQVSSISVSGYPGAAVELSVADPVDGWCEGAGSLWEIEDVGGGTVDMGLPGPFGTMRVTIVDVNDDRIVIAATVRGAATMADTAGLREVLDSLEIGAP